MIFNELRTEYRRTTSSTSRPVETGKEYLINITDTSRAGDGIAKIQGLVIFVKAAMAGGDKSIKIKINSGDKIRWRRSCIRLD
jgi:predicted RNA-binding protein with TRAM domain